MGRGHTPFGYSIESGMAVLCENEAQQIREIYAGYLSGLSYVEAAEKAGLRMSHGSVKRLLQNKHYLGDDFYPAIIDQQTYAAAEEERQRRSAALGRGNRQLKQMERGNIPVRFKLGPVDRKKKDPYEQAAYIYSLIESEV